MDPVNNTPPKSTKWKVLSAASLAHATHDGFTDMLYVFFPVWQMQMALSFAQVGLLKTVFSGALALFQIPSGMLSERVGERNLLLIGTVLTSLAVFFYGWVSSPVVLCLLLFCGGLGASVQHPISSSVVLSAYRGAELRKALSTFNFSGDIGKLIVPALAAFLISRYSLSASSFLLSLIGFASTVIIFYALKGVTQERQSTAVADSSNAHISELSFKGILNPGFVSLSIIALIDSSTRTVFLTFFPFLLQGKGAGIATIGLALSLVFAGGAVGKYVCGVLATRVGILRSVCLTEFITAICIASMIVLPLNASLLLAPFLGIALNGTSSVLCGSVSELVPEEYSKHAFSVYYTIAIGSGAIAPTLFGALSDLFGVKSATAMIALFVLLAIPLTLPLRGKLGRQ
jgi:MFS transporter, FSR family, fosmidomycin resistance protein